MCEGKSGSGRRTISITVSYISVMMSSSKSVSTRAGVDGGKLSRPSLIITSSPAQHFLYFLPLPHGHGSLRAGAMKWAVRGDAISQLPFPAKVSPNHETRKLDVSFCTPHWHRGRPSGGGRRGGCRPHSATETRGAPLRMRRTQSPRRDLPPRTPPRGWCERLRFRPRRVRERAWTRGRATGLVRATSSSGTTRNGTPRRNRANATSAVRRTATPSRPTADPRAPPERVSASRRRMDT